MAFTSPVSHTTVVSAFSCSIWDVMVIIVLRSGFVLVAGPAAQDSWNQR